MSNRFYKWLEDGDDTLGASSRYISEMLKTRRTTFTIRVPLAIAKMVDDLVDGDDTLKSSDV